MSSRLFLDSILNSLGDIAFREMFYASINQLNGVSVKFKILFKCICFNMKFFIRGSNTEATM